MDRGPGLWRRCDNERALIDVFKRYDFEVVRPDTMGFDDQVRAFRSAAVVAGQIGSSLYGTMWCPEPVDMFTFVNEGYVSSNEVNIANILGHRMHHYVFANSPESRTTDARGRKIGKSNQDYRFDFASAYDLLIAELDALG